MPDDISLRVLADVISDRHSLSDLGRLLADLHASKIRVSISWLWDDVIHVRIGDPLKGPQYENRVETLAEAGEWLRDEAVKHFPDSRFARWHRR